MNNNTKLILMAGGAVALTYALMEYYKKNVKGDATGTPTVPETDPMRASSFTASDDFFSNYTASDDFFGFTANEPFMNAGDGFFNGGGKSLQDIIAANKRKKIMGVKQKGSKKDSGLNFTASDNFFNAGGVPIATDEPNFKY